MTVSNHHLTNNVPSVSLILFHTFIYHNAGLTLIRTFILAILWTFPRGTVSLHRRLVCSLPDLETFGIVNPDLIVSYLITSISTSHSPQVLHFSIKKILFNNDNTEFMSLKKIWLMGNQSLYPFPGFIQVLGNFEIS